MLTHTDVPYDNRILKEMGALSSSNEGWEVRAIGVSLAEGNRAAAIPDGTTVDTLELTSRTWTALPRPLRYACTMIELVWQAVRRGVSWQPTVVHSHDTMMLIPAMLVAWWCGASLVYDAHELESNKNGGTAILSWGTTAIERLAWPAIDLLITVSPSIGDWYLRSLGPKPLAIVLNAPVTNPVLATAGTNGALRRRFTIPPGVPVFVYVGYLGRGRGLEKLIEAFSAPHRGAHLVLVGYGDLKPICEQAATRFSNVHLHEAVPHTELVALIRDADVGVCLIERVSLSDYLCLPNKLFEYVAAGVPVLASDFPEMRRVVETYSCGVLAGESLVDLESAISRIEAAPLARPVGLPPEMTWEAQADTLSTAYARFVT